MRFLRRRELQHKTGHHPAWLDKLEKQGKFPKRVKLGEKAVAWVEDEVDAWLKQKVAERDQAAA